jgi:hypothetical protein
MVGMQVMTRKYQKNLQLGGGIRNDAFEKFGGGENTGDTGTRVGPGATQKEAADILGNVVRAKPGTLREDGFKLESGTNVSVEAGFEILGGEDEFTDEVFPKVRDNGFLQRDENTIGIGFFFLLPVDLVSGRTKVGHGR